MRSPLQWTKARAIIFLRLTLVIATSYLLLTQGQAFTFPSTTVSLILVGLASSVSFFWLPRPLIESTTFGATLVVLDTIWITAVLSYSGYLGFDFYAVYFFVLFLAAVSENLAIMAMSTVLVSVAYLYSVFATMGAAAAWSSPTLIRLPFFFAVGAMYGFLTNRVRREREASERLEHMAQTDPLTNLPNRRTLEERMERGIARSFRTGDRMALLMFDLDDFKYVNDTYGHAIGDRMLIVIADRLRDNVRRTDVLGRFPSEEFNMASRLGGDEFAVFLTDFKSLDNVVKVAQRLHTLISKPAYLENLEIVTTASVGIAVVGGEVAVSPLDADSIERVRQQILVQADRALYRAKEEGRNGVKFHDPKMDREINIRIALEQELRGALDRNELFLEFQPQVELGQQSIIGAEALLRWRHPTRGMVPPNEFIPIAESSGQIQSIGEWVLRAACKEAGRWRKSHPPGVPVAVNLSPVQFRDPKLPDIVARALEEEGLSPRLLELELTEGVLLKATPEVEESLRKLHDEVGVTITLDDFGRGFASLEYLLRFPIDRLKVDRLFVGSVDEDSDSRAMVAAIIALAKSLGLVVVGEGVETESQLEFLRARGCDQIQGYYFSQPVSSQTLTNLLVSGGGHIRPRLSTRSASGLRAGKTGQLHSA